jgi:hypothetical protein
MYTAPALLAFIINVLCVGVLIYFLDDRLDCKGKETDTVSRVNVTEEDDSSNSFIVRPDVLAVLVCMLTRSARMLVTSNVDSIGSPYAALMFGFDETQVLEINAMVQIGIGILTTTMLGIQAFTNYTHWISERVNCVFGMCALLVFHLITFPYPFFGSSVNCPTSGNDSLYSWCTEELKAPNPYFYYISYMVIFGIALPCLNNSLQVSVIKKLFKNVIPVHLFSRTRKYSTRNNARIKSGRRIN